MVLWEVLLSYVIWCVYVCVLGGGALNALPVVSVTSSDANRSLEYLKLS